ADRGSDLRSSKNELLSKVVGAALNGEDVGVLMGELENGAYYITASSMETSGWVLISAYTQENIGKPAVMLADENRRIQEEAAEVYQAKTDKSKQTATVLSVLAAILMLAGSLVLGKRIVDPLNNITRRIAALREGDLEFKMEDAYRTGDEIEELAESFATLSHKTVQYVDTVKKVTAEKERIGTELSLATQIQGAMLPHIVPAFPDRTDFDICGSMEPAKEVGGDFFDYFLIDEDHLGMVIADVSGKGVPAALFMMASKIILQSVAMLGKSPGEVLSKTNEAICSNNEAEMFVTVWFGILELSSGRLKAANAGHEYPVLKRPDGTFEKLKDKHGFVLGAIDGASYKEYEIMLEKGTKLFQYTDGIPEAANTDDEMFGMERMIEALNEGPDATPEELLVNVREAVREFVGDAQQFDDMTMLCVEYKGK
ncbi:MAG: SpoIIE family protein phosphatase, partial [Lachnospiraceae bacterium]|nr:SpoIIE family protein phosphatase [Lachnospiraceae bacterium]